MDTILNFILEKYPILALIAIIAYIVHKLTIYHNSIQETRKAAIKHTEQLDKLNKTVDKHTEQLDELNKTVDKHTEQLDKHTEQLDKHTAQLDKHTEQLDLIIGKLTYISNWIMGKDTNTIKGLNHINSPAVLSDAGIELLEISGGKKCVDENLDFFIAQLDDLKLKTPLDVENNALAVVSYNRHKDMFNDIKNYVYYGPSKMNLAGIDIKLSLEAVSYVMSLYLRDKYLAHNPGVIPEDYRDKKEDTTEKQ